MLTPAEIMPAITTIPARKAILSAIMAAISIVSSLALLPLARDSASRRALILGGLGIGVIAALLVEFATVPA